MYLILSKTFPGSRSTAGTSTTSAFLEPEMINAFMNFILPSIGF
jgi:hypothetical protein